jgi:hypothetical protein
VLARRLGRCSRERPAGAALRRVSNTFSCVEARRALPALRDAAFARLSISIFPEESVPISTSPGPWPAFASYLGNYRSVVQVNRDFLSPSETSSRSCHGSTGHHLLNVLRERSFGRDRSLDFTAGREALLQEGLASYGLELAFPGEERLRFEREVLFPLAELDPAEAELYSHVEREMRRLAPLRVEGARAYLDGKRDRVQSAIWLENEGLVPAPGPSSASWIATAPTSSPTPGTRRGAPSDRGRRFGSRQEYVALVTEEDDET